MANSCLKPPIHRMGGKSLLTSWLCQHVPGHRLYCETFGGAGHLLFGKPSSPVEVLNDADSHLVNFFRVIQNPETRQALIDRLTFMPYARTLWQEIRSRWKQGGIPCDPMQSAAEWFYLNRSTFSGDQKRGGFAMPSTTGRNPSLSYSNAIDGLESIARRLRGVTIECLDYQESIRRYDSPGSLFYCDPPYLDAGHYYGKDFTQEDHHALARLLNGAKGKAMITHYQNGLYDELYQSWHKYEYSSFKGSHKSEGEEKPKTVEVLYCNFKPAGRTRSLFEGMNL